MSQELVWLSLFVGGFLAGVINILAGGGSLITMPLLIFAGDLPATAANGTARIALLVQNGVAVWRFRNSGLFRRGLTLELSAPILAGALVGALIGAQLPDGEFRRVLGAVTLLAAVLVVIDLPRQLRRATVAETPRVTPWLLLALFCAGLYGGAIQAGVGYLLLASMTMLGGFDLMRANAYKLLLTLAYTPIAIVIFAGHSQVDWVQGGILSAGQALGGWIASGAVLKRGEKLIRVALVAVVIVAGAKLLLGAGGE